MSVSICIWNRILRTLMAWCVKSHEIMCNKVWRIFNFRETTTCQWNLFPHLTWPIMCQRLEKLTNRLWPNLKNFNVDYRFVHIFRFLFYAHVCRSVSHSQWLQVIYNSCYENYIKCFQFRTFIGSHNCIQLIWKFIISEWIKSTIVRRNIIMYA